MSTLIGKLGDAVAPILDTTKIVTSDQYGDDTSKTYYRRPATSFWNYIKGKADALYQPLGSYLTAITKAMVENVLTGNITTHTHSQYLTTTAASSTYVAKENGKGLSSNDFTDILLAKLNGIEAGANKYVHPSHTIRNVAAATGLVLASISVNAQGHVTDIGSKMLAADDIPTLSISKISGLQTALNDKATNSALTAVKNLLDEMFTLEVDSAAPGGKRIKANFGVYTNAFLSAHGLNADGGGGGAAYDRLDEWSAYDEDKSGWVLSALLGHDMHTRLTAIEGDYVKLSELPSLSGYATEQWVLGKGYITQDALTPYLTKTDADGKFVTALGVSGKFLTWTRNGVTNNLTVPFATDADTLDGYHESSFLRARGLTRTDQEETPWDQIGIKGYYDALPAGLSSDVYPYGQVITLCETSARFEIYASHNSSAGNGLYFRTGWNNDKRPWQMLLDTGNYSTILDGRYSHTLTLQLNGTEIGTFNPTANKTINIGDVASAAALSSHTSNTTVHISATERALWNKTATDLSTILGSDSDTVINKWEEVVAFLDTYTEADTLAGLLSNKVDKAAGYGLSKNDFNDTLLAKLNSIEAGANRYVLPTASATVKGGIKVGSGLMMASEVLSVNLNASHIPALDWSKITTGKPTTLAGYGITDAKISGGVITLGTNTITPLVSHQAIYSLTFASGAFSAKTFNPKSAAATVKIPTTTDHIAEGGNLYFTNARAVSALSSTTNALQAAINTKLSEATFNAFKTAFDGMFELVNIGTDAAPLFAIHAKYGLYSDSFLSAHGLNDAGGNGGSSYSRLDAWSAYDSSKEGYVLSAKLGYDLYQNKADSVALSALASRVGTLEGKNYLDALTLNLNGSGNAVTAVALSADKKTLTVTKGATFLTQHQSLAEYLKKSEAASTYVTALGTSGNSLTWTKNGVVNNLTVPYADKSKYLPIVDFATDLSVLTTVKAGKDKLAQLVSAQGTGFGYLIDVPACFIEHWDDESAPSYNANSYAMIKIGAHYSGGANGQWLVAGHNGRRVGIIGRSGGNWGSIGWLAYTSDIPSLSGYATEQWVLNKGYLTAITKAMVENVLTGNITTHTHSQYLTQHQPLDHIDSPDTRNVATTPDTYTHQLRVNFKTNASNGLSDGGGYNGELHFKPYGGYGDFSGGYPHQLGFTANGNIWHRIATSATDWGAWKKFLDSENTKISGGVITINGASITPLTQHQSLSNYYTKGEVDAALNGYVTLNTAQTISGAKTFSNVVVVQDGIRILYANERGCLQLGNTDHKQGEISAWGGVTLGKLRLNASIVDVNGYVTANSFVRNGGSASQFLKADGSVDSNSYALASALGNYLPLAGGSMLNTNLVSNLNADLLDGVHKDAFNGAARYVTADMRTGGYYKIKIKANNGWMLGFKILAYQSYFFDEINISGYNYGNSYWFKPTASLLCSSKSQIAVTFGYDSVWNLWVAIPAMHYAGISVTDVANGFQQVSDVHNLFEIVYEETLTGTVQTVVTPSRHATIADNVASASQLQTPRLINGTAFNGVADITTAKWGMARNITIGNTAKSVDGSRDLAWSLAEIGALPLVGGTMANTNLVTNLNADMLDGFHETEFMRSRGIADSANNNDTLWSQIGIKAYSGVLPDGLTDTAAYNYGEVISFPYGAFTRFEIYANHHSSSTSGLYFRTGWNNGKEPWKRFATTDSNVASATKLADNATYTAWGCPFFANGKPQNVSGALRGVTELYTSGALWFKKTDESIGSYFFPAAGGGIGLYFHENYRYKLCTAYFAYNGHIGFGTVNPAYKVDIVGTAKISEGLLIGGLLSANGGISTTAITATEIHLGPITLKYSATDKGLQVIGGGLYTDSYLSAHGPSPTTVDYEARIAALESKIAQLESQLNA